VPPTTKRRMAANEFEAIRPFLENRISPERCEAARSALVDGVALTAVAEVYGWTRQAVNAVIKTAMEVLEQYHESQQAEARASAPLPKGWERVTLVAPSYLVTRFRAEIAEAGGEIAKEKPKSRRKKSPETQSAPGIKST